MKQPKQHKPHSKALFLFLLVLGCAAVLATGTYAAYTSSASVKRVVAASTQSSDDLRFSSSLLNAYDNNYLGEYAIRPVSVNSSGAVTIGITVCNYPQGKMSLFNDTTINYTMKVTFPEGYQGTTPVEYTGTLPGGTISTNSHEITIAEGNVSAVSSGYITVVVTAEPGEAVNNKTLAARLQIIPTAVTETAWEGQLMETTDYASTDAFNYHIYGTEECYFTLSWNSNKLALSRWSIEQFRTQNLLIATTDGSIKIHVGGADQPTSYLLQFYRVGPIEEGEDYSSLNFSYASDPIL